MEPTTNHKPAEPEDVKIGVYICRCGGNISDYLDTEKLAEAVSVKVLCLKRVRRGQAPDGITGAFGRTPEIEESHICRRSAPGTHARSAWNEAMAPSR